MIADDDSDDDNPVVLRFVILKLFYLYQPSSKLILFIDPTARNTALKGKTATPKTSKVKRKNEVNGSVASWSLKKSSTLLLRHR